MEKIYAALSAIQGEMAVEGISKDRKNQQQGYAFRGIDDVLNALAPLFKKYKVFCIPTVTSRQVTQCETKSGGNLFYTTIEADFTFYSAEDGSKLSGRVIGEAMDSADKSTNKAISAAMKYLCILTFCIPLQGENDADAVTHEVKPVKTPAKPLKQAPAPKLDPLEPPKPLSVIMEVAQSFADAIGDHTEVIGLRKTMDEAKVRFLAGDMAENEYDHLRALANDKLNSIKGAK